MYFILLDYLISGQSRVKCSVASPGGEAQDIFFFFFNKRDIFPLDACPCDSMKSMKGKNHERKNTNKRERCSHIMICSQIMCCRFVPRCSVGRTGGVAGREGGIL